MTANRMFEKIWIVGEISRTVFALKDKKKVSFDYTNLRYSSHFVWSKIIVDICMLLQL